MLGPVPGGMLDPTLDGKAGQRPTDTGLLVPAADVVCPWQQDVGRERVAQEKWMAVIGADVGQRRLGLIEVCIQLEVE